MKFITALATGLWATTVASLALPAPEAEAEPLPAALASLTDVQIIKYTVKDWQADTAIVSKFLDDVAAKKFRNNNDYSRAAKIAWLAEYSTSAPSYGNKAILDSYLAGKGNGSNGSNGTNGTESGNGTWTGEDCYGEKVKQWLEQLKGKNWKKDCTKIQDLVKEINEARCGYVLPATDGYFQAAGALIASYNPSKPDYSVGQMRAVRAKACRASNYAREVEDIMLDDIEK